MILPTNEWRSRLKTVKLMVTVGWLRFMIVLCQILRQSDDGVNDEPRFVKGGTRSTTVLLFTPLQSSSYDSRS